MHIVRIELLGVNEAPVIAKNQIRLVNEDAGIGSLVGDPVILTDVDHTMQTNPENIDWSIIGCYPNPCSGARSISASLLLPNALCAFFFKLMPQPEDAVAPPEEEAPYASGVPMK